MKISENQRIASVKTKLELEKEEAVKKVKEEMKVCNMLKVFISKGLVDLQKNKGWEMFSGSHCNKILTELN